MEELIIIKTLGELNELQDYLSAKEYVAFDTETTGVDKGSEIIGFSVCADVEVGYYVMLSFWNRFTESLQPTELKDRAKSFISSLKNHRLVMHNAVFDCWMVENNYGVSLINSLHTDTMILAHLLDENRRCGLKELATALYGEDSTNEQKEMKESVHKNGGLLTKTQYELYKADGDLIAKYGAKDAILTLKLFYSLVPDLYEQELDQFFYEDESMPLLRGPTYELNTTGLKVDPIKLTDLKNTLQSECAEAKTFIQQEIAPHVKDKYPGTGKTNHFNIGAGQQLAWLLFDKLGNHFNTLTKGGRELCKSLDIPIPYTHAGKREFIQICKEKFGQVYEKDKYNWKTKKMSRPKKVGNYWTYLACGKETLGKLKDKYKWVERLLEYKKNLKLLNTYVEAIEEKAQYGVIRPSFLQHGTTSGRYSSRKPNFQNLPRDDKRVKSCIIARPGNVFVGADYSQLEPRVFASFSKDERLLACFKNGDDFYSVIGQEVFEKYDCSLKKDDKNSFAKLYPKLRDISKVVALSSTYGTTAPKMAPTIDKTIDEAQEVINSYFEKFPRVRQMMLAAHEEAKSKGRVLNLFGRPRRMPKAMDINRIYGKGTRHSELPYEARNILNLAVNHSIQSTGASIMNRAAILANFLIKENATTSPLWTNVKIVLQVHDELILEGPEKLGKPMAAMLKAAMEQAVELPGVDLIAEPKIAYNLADLK